MCKPLLLIYLSHLGGSNPGPIVYKTIALPAELRWLILLNFVIKVHLTIGTVYHFNL